MCEIKNKNCEEMTRLMRTIEESGSKTDTATLVRFMALSNAIAKEIEKFQAVAKEVLPERKDFKETLFEDIEKKVTLSAGRKTTEYKTESIYSAFEKRGETADFLKIISIQKGKAVENLTINQLEILSANASEIEGKPSITVAKLSAKDKKTLLAG